MGVKWSCGAGRCFNGVAAGQQSSCMRPQIAAGGFRWRRRRISTKGWAMPPW